MCVLVVVKEPFRTLITSFVIASNSSGVSLTILK